MLLQGRLFAQGQDALHKGATLGEEPDGRQVDAFRGLTQGDAQGTLIPGQQHLCERGLFVPLFPKGGFRAGRRQVLLGGKEQIETVVERAFLGFGFGQRGREEVAQACSIAIAAQAPGL